MILVQIERGDPEPAMVLVATDAAVLTDEEKERILELVGGGKIISHYGIYPYPRQGEAIKPYECYYLEWIG